MSRVRVLTDAGLFVRCGNDGAEKNSDGIAGRKEARKGKAKA